MKKTITFITNSFNELEAYSSNAKLILKYCETQNDKYNISCLSEKKFFKKFNDIENKELIIVDGVLTKRLKKEFVEEFVDNELYLLADTIEYIKTLGERYSLSEKELKKLSKANSVLMEIFNNFEDYFDITDTLINISNSDIKKFKEQENHLKEIIM